MPAFDDDRIGRLEAATERLSQNVVGLSTSLALVSEINQRQVILEARTTAAESLAVEVAKTSVDKDTLDRSQQAYRKRIMEKVTAAVVIGTLALLSGATGLINYEHGIQSRTAMNKRAVYDVCAARDKQTAALRTFVARQVAIETSNPYVNEAIRKQRVITYTDLAAAYPVVDCKGLLK